MLIYVHILFYQALEPGVYPTECYQFFSKILSVYSYRTTCMKKIQKKLFVTKQFDIEAFTQVHNDVAHR